MLEDIQNALDTEAFLQPSIPIKAITLPRAAILIHARRHLGWMSSEALIGLDRAFKSLGVAPPGISGFVHWNSLTRSRLPKDAPWTAYPFSGGPYIRAGRLALGVLPLDGAPDNKRQKREAIADVITRPEEATAHALHYLAESSTWVFPLSRIEYWNFQDIADEAWRLSAMLPGHETRRILSWESRDRDFLLPDYADRSYGLAPLNADTAERRPYERFLWQYEANFEGLGRKAMGIALREAGYTSPITVNAFMPDPAEGRPHTSWWGWEGITHPWGVQMLYALRRMERGVWEGQPLSARLTKDGDNIAAFAGFYIERMGEGAKVREYWPGTGRWPALVDGHPRWNGVRFMRSACEALVDLRLVEIPEATGNWPVTTEPARLTNAGHRFLDILPPEMEDPDVMLRWNGGPGGVPRDEDIPAMDRWNGRVFRKLKVRLNDIREN